MSTNETKEIQHIAAAVRVLRESAPDPTANLADLEKWGMMTVELLDRLRARRKHLLPLTIVQSLITLFHDRVDNRQMIEWLRWGESWMPRTLIARVAPPSPSIEDEENEDEALPTSKQLLLEVANLPHATSRGKKRAVTPAINGTNDHRISYTCNSIDQPQESSQYWADDAGEDKVMESEEDDRDRDEDYIDEKYDEVVVDLHPAPSILAAGDPPRRLTRSSFAAAKSQQLLQHTTLPAAASKEKSHASCERPTKRARMDSPSKRSVRKDQSIRALMERYRLCEPRKVRFKCKACRIAQRTKPCLTVARGATMLDCCAQCVIAHSKCKWSPGERTKNLVYRMNPCSFYEPPDTNASSQGPATTFASAPPAFSHSGSGCIPPTSSPRRPLPVPKLARAKQANDFHLPASSFSRPHFGKNPSPFPISPSRIATTETRESSEAGSAAQFFDEVAEIPPAHSYMDAEAQVPSPHPEDDVLYRTYANHDFASLGLPPELASINLRAIEDALSPMLTPPAFSKRIFLNTSGDLPAIATLPRLPSTIAARLSEVQLMDRSRQYFNRLLINWANLSTVATDLRTTAHNFEAVRRRWYELQVAKVQNRGSGEGVTKPGVEERSTLVRNRS